MTGQCPDASHACQCPGQQSVAARPPFARVSPLHPPPPSPACGDPCNSGSLSISLKEKKEKDSSMLFFSKGKKKGKKKNNANSPACVNSPTVTKRAFAMEEGKATRFHSPLAPGLGGDSEWGSYVHPPLLHVHIPHTLTLVSLEEQKEIGFDRSHIVKH